LFGVKAGLGEDEAYENVFRFNARGARIDHVKLSERILPGESHRVQLALVNKCLVLTVPPGSSRSEGPEKPLPARTYVIDPVNGKILFACAHQPHQDKAGKK